MTRPKSITVLLFVVIFAIGAFSAVPTSAQPLNEIMSLMESHKEALQTLRADVRMAKWESQLKITDFQKGNVSYISKEGRNGYVRINWTDPVREILVVVKGKYVLYRPALGQAIKGKVNGKGNGKASNILAFISMSKRQLRQNYLVRFLGNSTLGGNRVFHLKLVPKGKQSYKFAELWIDKNGMPIQAKVIEKNNDSSTIRLTNLKKNVKIKNSVFRLKLPKSVKIIKG